MHATAVLTVMPAFLSVMHNLGSTELSTKHNQQWLHRWRVQVITTVTDAGVITGAELIVVSVVASTKSNEQKQGKTMWCNKLSFAASTTSRQMAHSPYDTT